MRQQGFTLIEVLIVIAVLGILATMAIPRLGNSIADHELNSAAQQMVSELRYLQQITVNSDTDKAIPVMKFSTNDYRISQGVDTVRLVTLPPSVRIYGTPKDIVFEVFTGHIPINGNQTITLTSTKTNKTRSVVVYANTGRIREY